MTMEKAAGVSKMHKIVNYFTDRVANMMLEAAAKHMLFPRPGGAESLSPTERYVIQRALYRYEIFCGLFYGDKRGCGARSRRRDQVRALSKFCFFGRSPPWVNEQLACVYDCLDRILSECKLSSS